MADFFSGSKPDLISMKSMNDLVDIVIEGGDGMIKQVSDNAENLKNIIIKSSPPSKFSLSSIYQNYIRPNIIPIVIIIVFLTFILFRYYSVKEEKFNPGEPVDKQVNRNSYVDVNLPVLYDIEQINKLSEDEIINKIKKKSKPFEESPQMDQNENCDHEEREIVRYGTNAWNNQQNGFPNAYFGNDYISTTSNAINFATDRNRDSLNIAANMIFQ